jgi:predicted nucleic acid-binding protein
MIVVDASLIVDVLLVIDVRPDLTDRLLDRSEVLNAPQLMDVEVVQVLRRYARAGWLSASRAEQALDDLANLPIERYGHSLLIPRIWEYRDNLSAYDATYLALADALACKVFTRDRRFAGSSICAGRVALV